MPVSLVHSTLNGLKWPTLHAQHPFIVNMYTTFQDESYLYMVLEYSIGGEFFTHLRKVRLLFSFTCAR